MTVIVGIWVFVSMINFILVQVENEIGLFASEPGYCMPFNRKLFTFGLCLGRVVGLADWPHTFYSGDIGRNGGHLLCGGIRNAMLFPHFMIGK